ncbi:MAG: peroxiredoxin [Candidatus Hodarchaeales archaeon]|jgi:peroxiredoxin Q/BCP
MVKIGDTVPDVEVIDQDNQNVKLTDFIGKKIIVYFYPKDDTPGCTKEACSFRDDYALFKDQNILIFGISKDSIKSHIKFKEKYNLPFPLLSDPNFELTKAFGAYGKKPRGGTGLIRSTFVINEDGKIDSIFGLSGFPKVLTATHSKQILDVI